MKIVLSPLAEKQLRKLSKIDQIAVAEKIRAIGDSSSGIIGERLKGYRDIFRVRVGDYRLVYRRFSDRYYIILIHHRKDVYQLLSRLLK